VGRKYIQEVETDINGEINLEEMDERKVIDVENKSTQTKIISTLSD
jgi:hypothetical protein